MASRTYIFGSVTGETYRYTRKKQGRPEKDTELKRESRYSVNLMKTELQQAKENAARFGMSLQKYAQMALTHPELFASKN